MPSYTPLPTDETQPTGDKPAGSAAPEFRALKGHLKSQLAALNAQVATNTGHIGSIYAYASSLGNEVIPALAAAVDMEILHSTVITTPGGFTWNKPADMPADSTLIVRLWGAGQGGEAATRRIAGTGNTATLIKQIKGMLGGMGGGYVEFAFPLSIVAASVNGSVGAGGVSPTEVYNGWGGDWQLGADGANTVWDTVFIANGGTRRKIAYGGTPTIVDRTEIQPAGSILGLQLDNPVGRPGIPRISVPTVGMAMLEDGFVEAMHTPLGKGCHHSLMGGPAGGSILLVGAGATTQIVDPAGNNLLSCAGGIAVVGGNGADGTGYGAGGGASAELSTSTETRKGGNGAHGRAEIYVVRGKQRAINVTTIELP